MKTNPHRWVKPMAVLFTSGFIFSTTCVPKDPLFKLGASTRALVFDTFGVLVANGVNESINGALFGTEAVRDTSAGDDGSTGGDASGSGSGNSDDGPPPFP